MQPYMIGLTLIFAYQRLFKLRLWFFCQPGRTPCALTIPNVPGQLFRSQLFLTAPLLYSRISLLLNLVKSLPHLQKEDVVMGI